MRVAIAQATAAVAAAALVAVLAKLALRDVPPFTFVWLQLAVGAAALTAYTCGVRGMRVPRRLGRGVWLRIAAIGLCNLAGVRLLFLFGLARLPATTHAYLVNLVGVVTMLFSAVMLRERPTVVQVAGVFVTLGGLRLYFAELPPPEELTGVAAVAAGVVALALTNNLTRGLRVTTGDRLSNDAISTLALWIGAGPVVLAGLWVDGVPPVSGWRNWSIVVLAGVAGTAVAQTVFNHVLRTLRSYEASVLASTGVVFTAAAAIPVLGELPTARELAGIAALLAGVALVQAGGRRARQIPPERG